MTPEQRERLHNYVIRGINAPLAGELRGIEEAYARSGLIGSPAQIAEQERARRATRQNVANTRAALAIDEQDKALSNRLAALTGAGGVLSGAGAMEKAVEDANAARRAEAQRQLESMMDFILGQMGISAGGYNNVMQAILNRYNPGGQGGAGVGDWAPWLAASLFRGK
jgi:hypothetical protein